MAKVPVGSENLDAVCDLIKRREAGEDWTQIARSISDDFLPIVATLEKFEKTASNSHLFELALSSLPCLISYVDHEYKYRYMNFAHQEWFGIVPQENIGESLEAVIGASAFQTMEKYLVAARGGKVQRFCVEMVFKHKGSRNVDAYCTPDLGERGELRGFICVFNDVTEQVERERKLRLLFETRSEGLILYSSSGRVEEHNVAALRILGLTTSQLMLREPRPLGWTLLDEHGEKVEAFDRPAELGSYSAKAGVDHFCNVRLPDGAQRWLHLSAVSFDYKMRNGQGRVETERKVLVSFSEVTELVASRQRLEQALNQVIVSEKSFRAIFENSPIGIIQIDKEMKFISANAAYLRFLGYSLDELKGKSVIDFTHPDDRTTTHDVAKKAFDSNGVLTRFSKRYVHKSGRVIWCLVTSRVIKSEFMNEKIYLSVIEDVTELREREAQLVEAHEELERARLIGIQNAKLASMGEMSAGIAHEINNPLAIISGSIDQLERGGADPEKLVRRLSAMKRAVGRIAKIVSGLRKFSRAGGGTSYRPGNLADIIREAQFLLESKLNRNFVKLEYDFRTEGAILCDAVEIEQVVVNLVNNSIDAIETLDQKWVKVSLFEDKGDIVLQVWDSGTGLKPEVEAKLFQPFFTTKGVGGGTGLGLSIVKGILDKHQARISVLGGITNTCFELRFNSATSEARAS